MGWTDWIWGGSKSTKEDPVKKLDPSLKEFLEKEEPKPYKPATVSEKKEPPPPRESPQQAEARRLERLPDTNKVYGDRLLPKQSLYQDGRYASLWKTYTPQEEVIANSESPAQRLTEYFKDRQQLIYEAALENCSFENEVFYHCFETGDYKQRARARATLCRKETKAFNRCYILQSKFLHALGYMSSQRLEDDEQNEAIQMHADELYHRMLAYEEACDEAQAKKQPPPPPFSVFDPERKRAPMASVILSEAEKLRTKADDFQRMSPQEQELQIMARRGDQRVAGQYRGEVFDWVTEQHENRNKRQAKVVAAVGEKVGKLIVPDMEAPTLAEVPEDPTKPRK